MQPTALSIAGFDPSAATGVVADLKTFTAFDIYGMAVVTTLTAQNSTGVQALQPLSEEFVGKQLEAVLGDADVQGVKIGMLGSARNTRLLADMLDRDPLPNVVLDPMFQTESSGELLDRKGIQVLRRKLLPLVRLVTPNLAEAAVLAEMEEIHEVKDMKEAARRIHALGVRAVVVKGGHLPSRAIDVAYDGRQFRLFDGSRVKGIEARGLGCTFSSAITAQLARGIELERTIDEAKRHVTRGLRSVVRVGRGRFHLDHFVHT